MAIIKISFFLTSLFFFLNISIAETITTSASPSTEIIPKTDVQQILTKEYNKYKTLHSGKNASYIPELAQINPNLFGIIIVTVEGKIVGVGDINTPFAIESVSKPFAYALALEDNGEDAVVKKIGLNATGQAFNSVMAIEQMPNHHLNPLVNPGAIQITSLIKGKDSQQQWQRMLNFVKKLSDGKPELGMKVYQSEMATNKRNRSMALLLDSYGLMYGNAEDAVDRYTRACSIMVTAQQLALMGATLANGGIHPVTHERLISSQYVRDVLADMTTNGLYNNSGSWWWTVGLPSKSGVGGGIVAIVPNKMAIVVFSPPLDEFGNSVRGQAVIKDLSQILHLHLLEPRIPSTSLHE